VTKLSCLNVFPKFLLLRAGNIENMIVLYRGKAENISKTAEKINNELFPVQMASIYGC
jgi:hypothetical protein